jgi:hypothetical protein
MIAFVFLKLERQRKIGHPTDRCYVTSWRVYMKKEIRKRKMIDLLVFLGYHLPFRGNAVFETKH